MLPGPIRCRRSPARFPRNPAVTTEPKLTRSPCLDVEIRLLETTKGHSLRAWSFQDRVEIRIGRQEDNDIIVSDPAVSRLHAILRNEAGRWRLLSFGKHGVLIDGRRTEEADLDQRAVFRLGPQGPTLDFHCRSNSDTEVSEVGKMTIEFDSGAVDVLHVDRELAAEQVRQIADDETFRSLIAKAAELRRRRGGSGA
jgi:pSer/pThr/pTyr-binding forkhead associated (FHA) protein